MSNSTSNTSSILQCHQEHLPYKYVYLQHKLQNKEWKARQFIPYKQANLFDKIYLLSVCYITLILLKQISIRNEDNDNSFIGILNDAHTLAR